MRCIEQCIVCLAIVSCAPLTMYTNKLNIIEYIFMSKNVQLMVVLVSAAAAAAAIKAYLCAYVWTCAHVADVYVYVFEFLVCVFVAFLPCGMCVFSRSKVRQVFLSSSLFHSSFICLFVFAFVRYFFVRCLTLIFDVSIKHRTFGFFSFFSLSIQTYSTKLFLRVFVFGVQHSFHIHLRCTQFTQDVMLFCAVFCLSLFLLYFFLLSTLFRLTGCVCPRTHNIGVIAGQRTIFTNRSSWLSSVWCLGSPLQLTILVDSTINYIEIINKCERIRYRWNFIVCYKIYELQCPDLDSGRWICRIIMNFTILFYSLISAVAADHDLFSTYTVGCAGLVWMGAGTFSVIEYWIYIFVRVWLLQSSLVVCVRLKHIVQDAIKCECEVFVGVSTGGVYHFSTWKWDFSIEPLLPFTLRLNWFMLVNANGKRGLWFGLARRYKRIFQLCLKARIFSVVEFVFFFVSHFITSEFIIWGEAMMYATVNEWRQKRDATYTCAIWNDRRHWSVYCFR